MKTLQSETRVEHVPSDDDVLAVLAGPRTLRGAMPIDQILCAAHPSWRGNVDSPWITFRERVTGAGALARLMRAGRVVARTERTYLGERVTVYALAAPVADAGEYACGSGRPRVGDKVRVTAAIPTDAGRTGIVDGIYGASSGPAGDANVSVAMDDDGAGDKPVWRRDKEWYRARALNLIERPTKRAPDPAPQPALWDGATGRDRIVAAAALRGAGGNREVAAARLRLQADAAEAGACSIPDATVPRYAARRRRIAAAIEAESAPVLCDSADLETTEDHCFGVFHNRPAPHLVADAAAVAARHGGRVRTDRDPAPPHEQVGCVAVPSRGRAADREIESAIMRDLALAGVEIVNGMLRYRARPDGARPVRISRYTEESGPDGTVTAIRRVDAAGNPRPY